jgi:putative colanic acid biosysnthesis UDP-glucose lipid carrier transferase
MNMISKLRPNQYSKTLILLLVIVDIIAITFSFNLTLWLQREVIEYNSPGYSSFAFAWLLLWIIISLFAEAYSMDNHRRIRKIFGYTFKLSLLHLPLSASVALMMGLNTLSFTFLADIYLLFITFSVGIKSSTLLLYRYICNLEKNKHRVVIVGYTPSGLNLHRYFTEGKSSGYHFAGFFDNNTNHPLVVGDIEHMKKYCVRENVNEIFYALPYDSKLIQEISSFADDNFIRFGILQDIGDIQVKTLHSAVYDNNLPVLSLKASAEKNESIKASYQKALSVLRSLNL